MKQTTPPPPLQPYIERWQNGEANFRDVVRLVIEHISYCGNASPFQMAPAEIKAQVLEDLAHFHRLGYCALYITGTDLLQDVSNQMKQVTQILNAANLFDSINSPPVAALPPIVGLEHITNFEPLEELFRYESRLLDCELSAFSIKSNSPTAIFHTNVDCALLVQHYRHEWLDDQYFRRVLVAQWQANLTLLHTSPQTASCAESEIDNPIISIQHQAKHPHSYFDVTFHRVFHLASMIRCREIKRVSLKFIAIDKDGEESQT